MIVGMYESSDDCVCERERHLMTRHVYESSDNCMYVYESSDD